MVKWRARDSEWRSASTIAVSKFDTSTMYQLPPDEFQRVFILAGEAMVEAAESVAGRTSTGRTNRPAFQPPEATRLIRSIRLLAAARKESRMNLHERVPLATKRAAEEYSGSTDFSCLEEGIMPIAPLLLEWKEHIDDLWNDRKTELKLMTRKQERQNITECLERARKDLHTKKRAVSAALRKSGTFQNMENLEQLYVCGVRLRGYS
eukprot:1359202-Rhodomonas_salina.4